MVASFRQATATVIGVPEEHVVNVRATAKIRGRSLSDDDAVCDVGYDVRVVSEAARETMKDQINTKMEYSSAFTTELRTRMDTNNVNSASSNSISADTTTNKAEAADDSSSPNNNSPTNSPNGDGDGSSGDATSGGTRVKTEKEENTGMVVGVVVGCVVVVALVVVVVYKKIQMKPSTPSRHPHNFDTQLSKINGVELQVNPLDHQQIRIPDQEKAKEAPLARAPSFLEYTAGNKSVGIAPPEKRGRAASTAKRGSAVDPTSEWQQEIDPTQGKYYYSSTKTQQSVWEAPANFQQCAWQIHKDEASGSKYVSNSATGETSWDFQDTISPTR